ncbi:MAG: ATP-dependent helicase [Candidatus Eisenbacteria bacterium]|nr:ATP-dependent helicase [Candidatus Eisenbacteria bacterium]
MSDSIDQVVVVPASGFAPTVEQAAILAHRPGQHARVLAGPGTGKSATLVALLTELLNTSPAPRVKLLTFTRAATAELAQKVSMHPSTAALRPSTMHSFALAVLMQNQGAGELPFPLRIADDAEDSEIVLPSLARRLGVSVTRVKEFIREMAANWQSLRADEDPAISPEERARFLGGWNEHRRVFGYTLLQELPYALNKALANHPTLSGVSYDLLIVDEYQDLNACDLSVLRQIADRGCSLIGAGDDDQSIYSWRKADPAGIQGFVTAYSGAADYPLSVTQRCGRRIIEWATAMIEGDAGRSTTRPRLSCRADATDGEVALLAFANQEAEAKGVAKLVEGFIGDEIAPEDILVLLRSDYNQAFSKLIKQALSDLNIVSADPGYIDRVLGDRANRELLALLRLMCNGNDSLAWATVLHLTPRVGNRFVDHVYDRARTVGRSFGETLLSERQSGFIGAPAISSRPAIAAIDRVLQLIATHAVPEERPANGWGAWILELAQQPGMPQPTAELATLVVDLDTMAEGDIDLARYLSQMRPLGKDRASTIGTGVRIMTMGMSKGLTARATIVAGAEEGVVPRPDQDPSEERRLLYVAMTRSKERLIVTWARQRTGPTARAGAARVVSPRTYSTFLQGCPVESEDGPTYVSRRWPRTTS